MVSVNDDMEWKLAYYEMVVTDPDVKARTWAIAEASQTEESPTLTHADFQCARRYLRACMLRASITELQALSQEELAGWWARGVVGACQYRHGLVPRRGRKRRRSGRGEG